MKAAHGGDGKKKRCSKGELQSSSTEGKYLYHNPMMIQAAVPVRGASSSDQLCVSQSDGQRHLGDFASRESSRSVLRYFEALMADVTPVPGSAEIRNLQAIQNFVVMGGRHQLPSSVSPSDVIYSSAHAPKTVQPKRSKSDFSIEAILARNPTPPVPIPQQPSKESVIKDDSNPVPSKYIQDDTSPLHHQLSWVHCTRYRPPKLPRVKREIATFRTRYRNPRIPFSTAEVAALEKKFRSSPYLGSHDVVELATTLNMSPKRIKIWFQNRRARERRENDIQ